jgi:predicted nucleotidyltransferase
MSTAVGQAANRTPTGTPGALAGRSVPTDVRAQAIDLSPLRTLLARIDERWHPEQIWLFGSRARGDAKPWSDWDLLVVLPDDAPEGDLDPALAWQLQKGSGVYADVIPVRASEFREDLGAVNTILYDVAKEGIRIDGR